MKRVFGKNLQTAAALYEEYDDLESYSGSNQSSIIGSDDDLSSEYMPHQKKSKRLQTIKVDSKEEKKIQRKPTRVPNLKINNRNALLARENRKRKKELLESLELRVEKLQAENKSLQKLMKSKEIHTERLVKEVKYYKSIIANSSQIVSILKSLPTTAIGNLNNSNKSNAELKRRCEYTSIGSSFDESLSCNDEETDLDEVPTQWNDISDDQLNSITDFEYIPNINDSMSPLSEISTEHNYSHYDGQFEENGSSIPGMCLHINTGRVSLEFCSVCHHNAKTNAWI